MQMVAICHKFAIYVPIMLETTTHFSLIGRIFLIYGSGFQQLPT